MNIAEILKNCPKGTPLYSPIFGECTFEKVLDNQTTLYRIVVRARNTRDTKTFTDGGKYDYHGECMLFPSRENRDWSTFDKLNKFILIRKEELFKPFDKVLVRDGDDERWEPDFFASAEEFSDGIRFNTITGLTREQCIAYEGNEHLINTIKNP